MNRTWIGCHWPIGIGPIVKPWGQLILPQCDITMRQTDEGSHICSNHYRRVGTCTCAECTSWVVLANTCTRCRAEAVVQDLLVAYHAVIDMWFHVLQALLGMCSIEVLKFYDTILYAVSLLWVHCARERWGVEEAAAVITLLLLVRPLESCHRTPLMLVYWHPLMENDTKPEPTPQLPLLLLENSNKPELASQLYHC